MNRATFGFPKAIRLLKRRQFVSIQRRSSRFVTDHFIVYARTSSSNVTQLGVTVSRKVGRAHRRNRMKRWLREVFRLNYASLPQGLQFVVVVRPGRDWPTYSDVETQFMRAASALGKKVSHSVQARRKRHR